MRLQALGTNRTLLSFENGTQIFFSYDTPVSGRYAGRVFRTAEHYSVTTSKMIREYLQRATGTSKYDADVVEQSWINNLLDEHTK